MAGRRAGEWLYRYATPLSVLLCLVATAGTFLRFLVTPLGMESFGRSWAYFVSYADFGFIRRGLIGTLLDPFLSGPLENDHLVQLILFPIFLLVLLALALVYARRLDLPAPRHRLFVAMLLLSPAFLAHYAYSTGDFNVVLAIVFVATMALLRRWLAVLALLVAGILVHEIYLLAFVPAVCVALYVQNGERLARPILYGAAAVAATALVLTFGVLEMGREEYLAIIHRHAPNIGMNGYFEMTEGIRGQMAYTWLLYESAALWILIVPSLVYWAIILWAFFPRAAKPFLQAIYVLAGAAPLLMCVFGSDLYRWVSLACVALIVLGGYLASRGYESAFTMRPWLVAVLTLPWILPGPFGSGCDPERGGCQRVYPMAQFAIERVLR